MYSVAKGSVVNTRNIEKVYKGNKLKVWAIYAVVTFYMQYHRSGSIPQAAKDTARQLRDEAIIRFLHGEVMKDQSRIKTKESEKTKTKQEKKNQSTNNGSDDYEVSDTAPDMSGYTERSKTFIRNICKKYKIKIITRPTNAAAKKLIESRQAVPKKMFVKNKTINELDTFLGASEGNIGKVGSFKPKLNRTQLRGLPKQLRRKIVERYRQRAKEWVDQAEHLKQNKDKLFVKDGVIHDKISGKPFTGDIDIFDIRGANGQKLPKATIQHVIDELKLSNRFSSVEHGAHIEWDWRDIKNPEDRRIAHEIYDKIVKAHTLGTKHGEPLVEFNPNLKPGTQPKSVFYKGKG
jgi:hypothetical protein